MAKSRFVSKTVLCVLAKSRFVSKTALSTVFARRFVSRALLTNSAHEPVREQGPAHELRVVTIIFRN